MSLDREKIAFFDSLYDVHSRCYRCSNVLGKISPERTYVQDRLRTAGEKSPNSEIQSLAYSLLETCEKCDTTIPLVARRIVRGETI